METKMTKEEAFDFLLGKKVLCLNQSETIRVQKKLFEIGYKWTGEDQEPIIDYFAIFIKKDELRMTTDINYWIREESENIKPNEILAIQIKEEPRFDPQTLQDFDKVLVRDRGEEKWKLDFFDKYSKDEYASYRCISNYYVQCVPYNEETKHLKGTTDEAPEFYQVWKK